MNLDSITVATRVKWTDQEKEEIEKLFKDNIKSGVILGLDQRTRAIQAIKYLKNRSWETVKKKVWNIIQKKKM